MNGFRITLKNYRCFPDEAPLVVEFRRGFTALVGPNNAGKSALLKFFHEMKQLWSMLVVASGSMSEFLRGNPVQVTFTDVVDPTEVFCNLNTRGLTFELEALDAPDESSDGARTVWKMIATAERAAPNQFRIRFLYGRPPKELPLMSRGFSQPSPNVIANPENQARYDLGPITTIAGILSKGMYLGAFRNAINQGANTYYSLAVGTQFIGEWHAWKTGGIKAKALAIEQVTKDLKSIFGFESLEINASEQLKTLAISVNGRPYLLSELGSGMAQFILVFGNAAIREPTIIFVDEPELNLHPSLQTAFLLALAEYSKGWVIFATHSLGLARTTAETIYSFQRTKDRSTVRNFTQTPNYAEFVGELSFSAFKELGCDSILLVEGIKDVRTVQQFLRLLKKDHRVVIIPLGGDRLTRGDTDFELNELLRITQNVFALVDSEREGEDQPAAKRREAFADVCKKLGIRCLLTERRALDNYLTGAAIKVVCGSEITPLGKFERLDSRPQSTRWDKSENWRIAGYMELADIETTDVGNFLAAIGEPTRTEDVGKT